MNLETLCIHQISPHGTAAMGVHKISRFYGASSDCATQPSIPRGVGTKGCVARLHLVPLLRTSLSLTSHSQSILSRSNQ